MRHLRIFCLLLASAASVLFLFQNCADTSFKKTNTSRQPLSASNGVTEVTQNLYNRSIYVGESTSFEIGVSAASGASVSFEWSKDGSPISNQQSSFLDVIDAQVSDGGTYVVDIYVNGQFFQSDDAVLEVLACEPGSQVSCSTSSGTGMKTCNVDGTGFGSCEISQCNAGYSYSGSSCKKDCGVPWGGSIAHGKKVTAWNASSSTNCRSESRTCSDGHLSGSYSKKSCTKTCPSGQVLRSGKCLIAKKTLSLGAKSCGSGYCGSNKPKKGGGNTAHCGTKSRDKADAICKKNGFKKSTGSMYISKKGKKARYCNPSGKGCFTNQNNSCNRYFTKITCMN